MPTGRSQGAQVFGRVLIKAMARRVLDNVVAHAGGGKALATPLKNGINHVTVCATSGDSLLLPFGRVGDECHVIHDGVALAQIFGFGSDTIDGVPTATGVSLSAGKRCVFTCSAAGAWQSNTGVKAT